MCEEASEKNPARELRKELEAKGVFAGQPISGPVENTQGVFLRPEGKTYTDLSLFLQSGEFPPQLLSYLEFHFQVPADAEDFIRGGGHFADQISFLRGKNPDLVVYAHAPFIEIPEGEREFFRFHQFLLSPSASLVEEYQQRGLKVEEIEAEEFYPLIEALGREGISYLSIHLSAPASPAVPRTPGYFLTEDEFRAAFQKVEKLARFAQKHGVTIGVETGGIRAKQLQELAEIENVKVTWDEEHAFLDGLEPEEPKRAESEPLYKELLDNGQIGLVHLAVPNEGEHTQSGLGVANFWQAKRIKDLVLLVADQNRERVLQGKPPIPIMLETTPDQASYEKLAQMSGGL